MKKQEKDDIGWIPESTYSITCPNCRTTITVHGSNRNLIDHLISHEKFNCDATIFALLRS